MIAWSESVVPSWVRVEDVSDTDHPTAVKIVLPCNAVTARSSRHLGVVYTGQPCGMEIVCDLDDANRVLRELSAALDRIRCARRTTSRMARIEDHLTHHDNGDTPA